MLVSDTTPITPILNDYVSNGKLNSLRPADVTAFLRTNLHWRTVGVSHLANHYTFVAFTLSIKYHTLLSFYKILLYSPSIDQ